MISQERESGFKSQKQPSQEGANVKKFAIKSTYRKSAINHYNKDDILKNKVDISTSNLAGIKQKHNNNRPNTSMDPKVS